MRTCSRHCTALLPPQGPGGLLGSWDNAEMTPLMTLRGHHLPRRPLRTDPGTRKAAGACGSPAPQPLRGLQEGLGRS